MGISTQTANRYACEVEQAESQSLSGWDGDFHFAIHEVEPSAVIWKRRNPFQGGMGISTGKFIHSTSVSASEVAIPFRVGWGFPLRRAFPARAGMGMSQSLSGWDGDFHERLLRFFEAEAESQSLSGWDGDFHERSPTSVTSVRISSQSLSGWDGDFHLIGRDNEGQFLCRNPFQGGMGISTPSKLAILFL